MGRGAHRYRQSVAERQRRRHEQHEQDKVRVRCPWVGIEDAEYTRYHDEEWGVPHADDRLLFEKLVLEGFQSGLSWLTILKKRPHFRKVFHDFDAERIARYTEKDKARLMADPGIIRNRLKIEATIDNARAFLKLQRRARRSRHSCGASSTAVRSSMSAKHSSEVPPPDRAVDGHLEGPQEGRLPLRRTDDRLCLHAVVGLRQRSPRDVPPTCALRQAAARIQGAGLMDIASGSARRHCDRHRTRLSYQA